MAHSEKTNHKSLGHMWSLVYSDFGMFWISLQVKIERWYRRHFTMRFGKNVFVSKQTKNTVAALAFFDQQKGSVTSNKNNRATYNAKKEKD